MNWIVYIKIKINKCVIVKRKRREILMSSCRLLLHKTKVFIIFELGHSNDYQLPISLLYT